MQDKILRKLLSGFIQIHILHHGKTEPFYGSWMIEELNSHGYVMSPGTLYPLLRSMTESGLLVKEDKIVDGKVRKYYSSTAQGSMILEEARSKAYELFKEMKE